MTSPLWHLLLLSVVSTSPDIPEGEQQGQILDAWEDRTTEAPAVDVRPFLNEDTTAEVPAVDVRPLFDERSMVKARIALNDLVTTTEPPTCMLCIQVMCGLIVIRSTPPNCSSSCSGGIMCSPDPPDSAVSAIPLRSSLPAPAAIPPRHPAPTSPPSQRAATPPRPSLPALRVTTITATTTDGCFPGETVVITREGPKNMTQVVIGDEILGRDPSTGLAGFSVVRAWLHRDTEAEIPMTQITTEAGSVIATDRHNMFVQGAFIFAGDVAVGHKLLTQQGDSVSVRAVEIVIAKGLYNPLTEFSNLFVGADEVSLVLAHALPHITEPERYESLVHKIVSLVQMIWPQAHEVAPFGERQSYLHPVFGKFAFLAERV